MNCCIITEIIVEQNSLDPSSFDLMSEFLRSMELVVEDDVDVKPKHELNIPLRCLLNFDNFFTRSSYAPLLLCFLMSKKAEAARRPFPFV